MSLTEHWRALCRGMATLLAIVSFVSAYWWFYKLGPTRHTWSWAWRSAHSEREYWHEVQKAIHRGMWSHDDGLMVARYGDKSWAEWIMGHVSGNEDMSCFGRLSHAADAMKYITNQDVGYNADKWLDWWSKNKSKSQVEWLADGFRQRGIEVDVPPSADQMSALLELLSDSGMDESEGTPEYLKYNAFRCLRESDFDTIQYANSNRPLSADFERGLLEYGRLNARWPAANDVGILPFRAPYGDWEFAEWELPAVLTPKYQAAAYSLIVAPLLLAAALFAWSFKTRPAC